MIKDKINKFLRKVKKLNGDPHYVALGMAIGVFIAITPTIPFHTILAIALALLLKASKPAAILGVWVSNPVTVIFLYYACYKTGYLFFDNPGQTFDSIKVLIHQLESNIEFSQKIHLFNEFVKTQMKMFMIMNFGGIVLGVPGGAAAYIITKNFFSKYQEMRHKT